MVRAEMRVWQMLLVILLALGIAACGDSSKGGGGGGSKSDPITTTITGQVTGSGGLSGITVAAGGSSETTDSNGFFRLTTVPVPDNGRVVVNFSGSGRVPTSRIIQVGGAGEMHSVSLSMRVPTDTTSLDLTNAANDKLDVADADSGENRMTIENLREALGTTGTVEISSYYGDPTTAEGQEAFPGNFMAARPVEPDGEIEESDIILESVVFTDITILDDSGEKITELNDWIKVEMRLPDDLQARYQAGDYIEWWAFDEELGIWVQEHAFPEGHVDRVLQADGYSHALLFTHPTEDVLYARAYARHLSWWNVDVPVREHAVVCVNVVDEAGAPLANINVEARGVTFSSATGATTGANGRACMTVKRSQEEGTPERVKVVARKGSALFTYDVTNADEGVVADDEVYVPSAAGSTLDGSNPENWLILANDLVISYNGIINGTVSYDTGAPVAGATVYTDLAISTQTDADGKYELKVPRTNGILVYVPGASSGSQRVDVGADPVTVDFTLSNQAPVINSITANPGLVVGNSSQVIFSANASDPDSDPITYQWSANAGTPASGTGASFTWFSPASGPGTAVITLTVTDDKGATASAERSVVYGGAVGGTELKLTIKDNPASDQPVAGVHVILHQEDNVEVEEYKTTGADGVADFGNIGRGILTVTVAREYTTEWGDARELETLVEIGAGDHVFYLAYDELDEQYCNPQSADYTVHADFNAVPEGVDAVRMLHPWKFGPGGVTASIDDIPVCQFHLENGNKISLLAVGEADSVINSYGWLAGVDPEEGARYVIDLDRTPAGYTWNTVEAGSDTPAPINFMAVRGVRQGVAVGLANVWSEEALALGTMALPGTFPVDSYVTMIGSSGENESERSTRVRHSTLAENSFNNLPLPGMTITALTGTDGVYSWTTSGGMDVDLLQLFIFGEGDDQVGFDWNFLMPGDKTGLQIPQLPEALAHWHSAELYEYGLSAIDWDAVDDFEHLLALFLGGDDPDELSSRVFHVSRGAWQEGGQPTISLAPGDSSSPASTRKTKDSGSTRPVLLRR